MIRAAFFFFAMTVTAATAAAQPLTVQCTIVGPSADYWGPLVVTIDEAAHHVRIDAPARPQVHNNYWDGAIGPTITIDYSDEEQDVHEQFFRKSPSRIEFGWRSVTDGRIGHYAWIDTAALSQDKPCLFHSTWLIGRG
jgi:hypothetical protein